MNWSERTRALLAKAQSAATEDNVWTAPTSFAGLDLDAALRNDAEKLSVLRDIARKVYWLMLGTPGMSADERAALDQLDKALTALDKRHE